MIQIIIEVRSLKLNKFSNISFEDETEKIITEENIVEQIGQRRAKQRNDNEPELPEKSDNSSNIFPVCENEEIFDCQENKSNEVLDESCKGILMFTSETSYCSCRGINQIILGDVDSNDLERNSEKTLRQGWSKYTRFKNIRFLNYLIWMVYVDRICTKI